MNLVALSGRLTRDPEYSMKQNGADTSEIARFTLAVDRDSKDAGADFISCVAFNKTAHFVQQYFSKGRRIELEGHIQTGSYTDREGKTVYTTNVVAHKVKFGESKGEAEARGVASGAAVATSDAPIGSDEFMKIADGVEEELPFA